MCVLASKERKTDADNFSSQIVYITGGIAGKNLSWITEKTNFLEIMLDKGRVSPALKKIPVKVVLVDDCGERGAHLYAFRMLRKV